MSFKFSPKFLIIDIEGTTSSISFVKETLFPYVLKSLSQYLNDNWNKDFLHKDIKLLREDALKEHSKGNNSIPLIPKLIDNNHEQIKNAVIENIKWQMSIDRKSNSLKQLQGHIWKKGYEDGSLLGHVYQDVPKAFKKWTVEFGIKIYIYSSGSIEAQKLIFGHSCEGNLLTYISGHFDTAIGSKLESTSYTNILKELKTTADDVLFLTDSLKEAKAANNVCIKSIILIRPGNSPIDDIDFKIFSAINSFDELELSKSF